jgi:phage terminase large subunit-like protein
MVETLDRHTGGLFTTWVKQGWVAVCEGDAIDYGLIHTRIVEDAQRYDIRDLGIDRWNSQATINFLTGAGIPNTALSQGYALSGAMQETEKLVKAGGIRHDGNPVLRWNVNSAEVKRGVDERIRLVKPFRGASGVRVDGVAAMTMAIDRLIGQAATPKPAEFAFYSL